MGLIASMPMYDRPERHAEVDIGCLIPVCYHLLAARTPIPAFYLLK
jgi:hypothetical protein